MTPRWEQLPNEPAPPSGVLLMDAVLTPNRSLSVKAFTLLIGMFVAINVTFAVFFALRGAYPVLAFLALDVGLLWLAFQMNYRSGRAVERIRVAADRLHVSRAGPEGRASHYVVSPVWARVEERPDVVRIAAGGRIMDVGAFLSPLEREAFADALRLALHRARRG